MDGFGMFLLGRYVFDRVGHGMFPGGARHDNEKISVDSAIHRYHSGSSRTTGMQLSYTRNFYSCGDSDIAAN